jgi:low affinity Fe/Cu permease
MPPMVPRTDDPTMQQEEGFGPRFDRIADGATRALGSLPALVASVALVVAWGLTGPLFDYSDTWQLFINTTTTVITFWMVFVIQNSANRQSKATQLKLDELIRALADARNEFVALDHATEAELAEREEEFGELAEVAEEEIAEAARRGSTGRGGAASGGTARGGQRGGARHRNSPDQAKRRRPRS